MKSKLLKAGLCALVACGCLTGCAEESAANTVDLNSMTFEEIAQKASEDGEVNSVGMPDTWANWGETWTEIEETYGITHTDTDMSSAEELALFANEANDATKDIGDVGQSFGPVAENKVLHFHIKHLIGIQFQIGLRMMMVIGSLVTTERLPLLQIQIL